MIIVITPHERIRGVIQYLTAVEVGVMVYRIVALGFAILFLSGCVVGRKHDFRNAQAVLDYQGEPVALGVQDLRSYVVYGDKDEISRASRAPATAFPTTSAPSPSGRLCRRWPM